MPSAPSSTANSFERFDIRLDPWAVEYGAETPTEFPAALGNDEAVDIDVTVERTAAEWAPVQPRATADRPELAGKMPKATVLVTHTVD